MTSIWVCIIVCLSTFTAISIFDTPINIIERASGTTLYVNSTGSGGAYPSIQDAINTSNNGNTIFVFSGIYYENILVNKSINLIGENTNTTIIDGDSDNDVVTIIADFVNISGFTVRDCDTGDAGIELYNVTDCLVTGNNLTNNYNGIHVIDSSYIQIISNNASNNYNGIHIADSRKVDVTQNHAYSNDGDGIMIYRSNENNIVKNIGFMNHGGGIGFTSSALNNITYNTFYDNSWGIYLDTSDQNWINYNNLSSNRVYGVHFYDSNWNDFRDNFATNNPDGIFLRFSTNNTIWNNVAMKNENGIFLQDTHDCIIKGNTLRENIHGMNITWDSAGNRITNNIISSNTQYGIYSRNSQDNHIYHNNIIDNTISVYASRGDNHWDDGYPNGGNFWSDYAGIDMYGTSTQDTPPSDGIGDSPYIVNAGSQDNYPLIDPNPDTIAPRIQLAQPENNSVIGLREVIMFHIFDGNLDHATYSKDYSLYDIFTYPYTINISSWEDGLHTIYVRAGDDGENEALKWFKITVDAVYPYVITTSPINESLDIDVYTTINISFSEPMNQSAIEDHVFLSPSIGFNHTWDASGTILSISFAEYNLTEGKMYNLTIHSHITDMNGNPMESDFILTFTTKFPLLDTDEDGILDIDDDDDDNDSVTDDQDPFPRNSSEWLDTDNDGIGNNADSDDDEDGVSDEKDDFPLDPTRWEKPKEGDFTIFILLIIIIFLILFFMFFIKKRAMGVRDGKEETAVVFPQIEDDDEYLRIHHPQIFRARQSDSGPNV